MGKRTYIRHTWKGKATLTTWTQTRCLRSQRFLSNTKDLVTGDYEQVFS